jgi:ribonuclease BN (tRNA processing enzyme)
MKITVLGSGTIISDPSRFTSAFLLEQKDNLALLDMGPGILQRLKQLKIDLLEPQTLFITHFHLDHCADVLPFLMARYLLDKKANAGLTLFGPEGLKKWYDVNATLQGGWLSDCPPKIAEFKSDIEWADYHVSVYNTAHTKESIAYRFDGTKRIFFSSDTGYDEGLIAFAGNADLGILECSHPDEKPVEGHLTPKLAGRLAQKAGFKRLGINHIYPENDKPALEEKISGEFNGKIIILADFMNLEDI